VFSVIPGAEGNRGPSYNMIKTYYVYILASKRNGTLYTGVTNDLSKRVTEHKSKKYSGFTSVHNVSMLVYYEMSDSIAPAIAREKEVKHWKREWRIALIEQNNPEWKDLSIPH